MGTRAIVVDRRFDVAGAFFSVWVVAGLFLDGWAHNAELAETFWTPWHAVMYAGFFCGGAYAAFRGWQARKAGLPMMSDPLVGAGFLAFLLGGLGDAGWHTVFGVEEDLEALLSPTHLMLMIGGLLLTTSTLRSAWTRPEPAPWFRTLLPAIIGMTLAIAIVAFFLQFASPFRPTPGTYVNGPYDMQVALAVMGMIATTTLLAGATFVLRARWTLPPHTLLFVYTFFALFMTGLHGFREVVLVLPAALAGALADALLRQGVSLRVVGAVVPAALWLSWFATFHATWGLDWTPELWLGAVVMCGLTGLGLSYLAQPPAAMRVITAAPSSSTPAAATPPPVAGSPDVPEPDAPSAGARPAGRSAGVSPAGVSSAAAAHEAVT